MSQLKLYHYWRSSCSWRVRWALAHKDIAYESEAINLLLKEQQSPEHIKRSPAAQVPSLSFEDQTLSESIAILEWLEESFPEKPLLPKAPWDRARVRQLVGLIACGTQPVQNLKVLQYADSKGLDKMAWAKYFIYDGLAAYERLLEETSGQYSYRDQVTLADLCLIPQVYNAKRFDVDMSRLPRCKEIYQRCLSLEACEAAAPHNQEGAQ